MKRLTTTELAVLRALKSRKAQGYDVPTLAMIATRSGFNVKTVYRAVNKSISLHAGRLTDAFAGACYG